jgi:hypothetical protein
MRARTVGVLIASALLAACHTVRPVTFDDLKGDRLAQVWVTRSDDSVVLVEDPQLFRGKLVGFVQGKYRELPPEDVKQLLVRRLARGKTLALVGAGALAFTIAAFAASGTGTDRDPCIGSSVDCREVTP